MVRIVGRSAEFDGACGLAGEKLARADYAAATELREHPDVWRAGLAPGRKR